MVEEFKGGLKMKRDNKILKFIDLHMEGLKYAIAYVILVAFIMCAIAYVILVAFIMCAIIHYSESKVLKEEKR